MLPARRRRLMRAGEGREPAKEPTVSYLEAAILGIVQGIFMFVPVSSTAHLVLTQHLMIEAGSTMPPPESPEMILFDLVVHVGTMVSVAVVFWSSLRALTVRTIVDLAIMVRRAGWPPVIGPFLWLMLMGALTVLVTGVLGLIFKSAFELVFGAPRVLVLTLSVTAVLLYLTDRLEKRQLGIKAIGPRIAIVVGIAQFLALIPGFSRSGLTIIAGLFSGLKRRWAAEYSFLVAIPTILAASLLQAVEVFDGAGLGGVGPGPLLVGFVVSAAVGIVALRVVLVLLFRAQLKVFSVYLLLLAGLVATGALDGLL
jgi:undecaprenyl-diphosphatase